MPKIDQIVGRVSELQRLWDDRAKKRLQWLALKRGFDPRFISQTGESIANMVSMSGGHFYNKGARPLYLNDSMTMSTLIIHMLSGRPISWRITSTSKDTEKQAREFSNAEKLLHGLFDQNNRRLFNIGRQRFERSLADSAVTYGTIVTYKATVKLPDGGVGFVIDSIDPRQVFESFDDEGIAEVVRVSHMNLMDIYRRAEVEPSWDASAIASLVKSKTRRDDHRVEVFDYWKHEIDAKGKRCLKNAIYVAQRPVKPLVEEYDIEHPYDISYVNGESFPGGDQTLVGISLLEPLFQVTVMSSDLMKKVYDHAHKTMAADYTEQTFGGRPVMDSETLDPNDAQDDPRAGVSVTPYDASRGEVPAAPMRQNPFDPMVQVSLMELAGQRQRAGVPYTLFGETPFALSGFAIQKLREGALASAGEVSIIIADHLSRLGFWALKEFRDRSNGSINVSGFVPRGDRKDYFHQVIKPKDIGDFIDVRADVSLAIPSDLTERMNLARASKPSAMDVLTGRTMYEVLLPDVVSDVQGEIDGLEEESARRMPQFQLLSLHSSLMRLKIKAMTDGDTIALSVLDKQIQLLEQQIVGRGGQTAELGTPPTIPPNTLSTPARTGGIPQQAPLSPQLGGPASL